MTSPDRPLDGRVALVTGVSRSIGIGAAVAHRLHDLGASVAATGWSQHDAEMPWGEAPVGPLPFSVGQHDLSEPDVPAALIDEVLAGQASAAITSCLKVPALASPISAC